VEAMLSGTPVVMANTPGGRVPVQVTGMGELAQIGDYRSIGETIVKVLQNRDSYAHTREQIEDCFSFQETVDQHEALYKEHAKRG